MSVEYIKGALSNSEEERTANENNNCRRYSPRKKEWVNKYIYVCILYECAYVVRSVIHIWNITNTVYKQGLEDMYNEIQGANLSKMFILEKMMSNIDRKNNSCAFSH